MRFLDVLYTNLPDEDICLMSELFEGDKNIPRPVVKEKWQGIQYGRLKEKNVDTPLRKWIYKNRYKQGKVIRILNNVLSKCDELDNYNGDETFYKVFNECIGRGI